MNSNQSEKQSSKKLIVSILPTSRTSLRIHIHDADPKPSYRPEYLKFSQIGSAAGHSCN